MLRGFLANAHHRELVVSGLIFTLLAVGVVVFNFWSSARLPAMARLDSVKLDYQPITQVHNYYSQQVTSPTDPILTLTAGLVSATTSSSALGVSHNPQQTLDQMIAEWQHTPWWEKLKHQIKPTNRFDRTTPYSVDQAKYQSVLSELGKRVNIDPKPPSVTLNTSGQPKTLQVFSGEPGQAIDFDQTQARLVDALRHDQDQVVVVTRLTGQVWSASDSALALDRAKSVVGKNITLNETSEHIKITLNDKQLVGIIGHPQGLDSIKLDQLTTQIADQLNRPPQDAKFDFDQTTMRVNQFVPDKPGLGVDTQKLTSDVSQQLEQLSATTSASLSPINLVMTKTTAQVPLSATNDLGIESLIGYGESKYAHSIPSRIHNVSLATSRINHFLVPPDSEFSFNKAIGDVSQLTGFKPAYIIQNGQTVLGDGGGVCQVSTTLFRALLNAGLPVTRRLPHSYRVSYYELDSKPGVDATVFSGNTDLRFKNDTGHYVLIHGAADAQNLSMYFELYGTDSGRRGQIVNHVTWDPRPALAPQFIPDPSLPTGVKKQIDWAASGIKAKFTNRVTDKDGQVLREDIYTSNYRPWAAKYLVGQ